MPLPPGFLDELRARLPVSEVVGRRVPLQRSGRELKACCPFHKEKSPSFTVNDQKGFAHCFGCGWHGDAIGFVMQHDRLGFMEAVELLATQAGLAVPQATGEERAAFERRKTLHDLVEAACAFFEDELRGPAGRAALVYLQRRGLDDETIARFRLGYAPGDARLIRHLRAAGFADAMIEEAGLARKPEDGRDLYAFFRNRVMFPVADQRGRVVAFGGRILEGEGAKYINSPDGPLFHKGKLLYGLSRAREAAAQGQTVIVAEGYMDVIALVRAGFEASVAPLGTALTEEQAQELWKMAVQPVLCFDGDEAGRRAAWRAVDRVLPGLRPDHGVRVAFLPAGEDPDSLIRGSGAAAMTQAIEAAPPLAQMLWDRELTRHRLDTPEGRAGLRSGLDAQAGVISDRGVQSQFRRDLRLRFDEAFPWRPPGKRLGQPARLPGPRPSRPVHDEREDRLAICILLVLLEQHPPLVEEFGESLALLQIDDPGLYAVRQRLLDPRRDSDGLDLSGTSDQFPKPDAYRLQPGLVGRIQRKWPFTSPTASLEAARAGWHLVRDQMDDRAVRRDHAAAARVLAGAGSDADLARWRALRREADGRGGMEDR